MTFKDLAIEQKYRKSHSTAREHHGLFKYCHICHIKKQPLVLYGTMRNYFAITIDWMIEGGIFWLTCKKTRIQIGHFLWMFRSFSDFFFQDFQDLRPLILKNKICCMFFPIKTHINTDSFVTILTFIRKKKRSEFGSEKWPIWVPFFACQSENVPPPFNQWLLRNNFSWFGFLCDI